MQVTITSVHKELAPQTNSTLPADFILTRVQDIVVIITVALNVLEPVHVYAPKSSERTSLAFFNLNKSTTNATLFSTDTG